MKKNKNRDAQKKRSSHKSHGVSPSAGRESTVEKICKEVERCKGSPSLLTFKYERSLYLLHVTSEYPFMYNAALGDKLKTTTVDTLYVYNRVSKNRRLSHHR